VPPRGQRAGLRRAAPLLDAAAAPPAGAPARPRGTRRQARYLTPPAAAP